MWIYTPNWQNAHSDGMVFVQVQDPETAETDGPDQHRILEGSSQL